MATTYILARESKPITRREFLNAFQGRTYLSDDAIKKGVDILNTTTIGVNTGRGYVWCAFDDDLLTSTSDYGIGNENGHVIICSELGIDLCCEHDDDYDRNLFPVDVDTTAPDYKSTADSWEVYIDCGRWYAFNRDKCIFIVADAVLPSQYSTFEHYLNFIRELYD